MNIFIFSVFCFGSFVLFLIEVIIIEEPKRPVSKGSKGCFNPKFNVDIPRNPEIIVIIAMFNLFDFSL